MQLRELHPYGSDRLTIDDDAIVLDCRVAKGWHARTKAPGTTIVWEEMLFEVVSEETLPNGATRYVLERWSESDAVRTIERYDAASEADRAARRRLKFRRMRRRRWLLVFSPVIGLAPTRQLEEIDSEYGIHATMLTAISSIGPLVGGSIALVFLFVSFFTRVQAPPQLLVAGAIIWIESLLRLGTAARGEPLGSLLGVFAWNLFRLARLIWRRVTRPRRGSDALG